MSKYPYIPDKNMYAAVMFACKMIRENGWFNKAIEKAADYYNVDEDDLKTEIRKRQSVGQKNANTKRVSKKYRWYLSQACCSTQEGAVCSKSYIEIIRASSFNHADNHFTDSDFKKTMRNDTGSYYSPDYFHEIVGDKNGYATKAEAESARNKLLSNNDIQE